MKYILLFKKLSCFIVTLMAAAVVGVQGQEAASEMLKNGDFSSGTNGWILESRGSDGKMSIQPNGMGEFPALAVEVNNPESKEAWKVQLSQRGMLLKGGKRYRISFYVMSTTSGQCFVTVGHTVAPYDIVKGIEGQAVKTETNWKQFTYEFAPLEDETQVRLIVTNLNRPATTWNFAKFSLVELP